MYSTYFFAITFMTRLGVFLNNIQNYTFSFSDWILSHQNRSKEPSMNSLSIIVKCAGKYLWEGSNFTTQHSLKLSDSQLFDTSHILIGRVAKVVVYWQTLYWPKCRVFLSMKYSAVIGHWWFHQVLYFYVCLYFCFQFQ